MVLPGLPNFNFAGQSGRMQFPLIGDGGGGSPPEDLYPFSDIEPLTPHRYWAFFQTLNDAGMNDILALTEFYFKDSEGAVMTGTTLVSGTSGGSPANLTDGNTSTMWFHFTSTAYVGLDLGAGNEDIPHTCRAASRIDGFAAQAFRDGYWAYSDNGADWTPYLYAAGVKWIGDHGFFKEFYINRPWIVQFEVTADQLNDILVTLAQIEFTDGLGGTDLTVPRSVSELSSGAEMERALVGSSNIGHAFDNLPLDGGFWGNSGLPAFAEHRFSSRPLIEAVRITARDNIFHTQSPAASNMRFSRDGLNYTTLLLPSWDAWTVAGQVQEREIPSQEF